MRTVFHNPFTNHPNSVGESYFEHLRVAASFSMRLSLAALACFLHAVFPFLFVKTGSHLIDRLHDEMVQNRSGRNIGIE